VAPLSRTIPGSKMLIGDTNTLGGSPVGESRPPGSVRGRPGILDPTKVTRLALQNAASVAALFLTTEASIAEAPKEKVQTPAPVPDMDM
jgi:hypothetical protein